MVTVIKDPKYSIFCKSCKNTLAFELEDVICLITSYCNSAGAEGGDRDFYIKRYFIICPECGGHPNVERVASKKMKEVAEKRLKNRE